jgi:hypothetical protein
LGRLSAGARTTGGQFTAERTFLEYQRFVGDLRARRPLRPWPAWPEDALAGDWDVTAHNPWLPRPHPLRKLAHTAWGWLHHLRNRTAGRRSVEEATR